MEDVLGGTKKLAVGGEKAVENLLFKSKPKAGHIHLTVKLVKVGALLGAADKHQVTVNGQRSTANGQRLTANG